MLAGTQSGLWSKSRKRFMLHAQGENILVVAHREKLYR